MMACLLSVAAGVSAGPAQDQDSDREVLLNQYQRTRTPAE